jgi:hypothetical protein
MGSDIDYYHDKTPGRIFQTVDTTFSAISVFGTGYNIAKDPFGALLDRIPIVKDLRKAWRVGQKFGSAANKFIGVDGADHSTSDETLYWTPPSSGK